MADLERPDDGPASPSTGVEEIEFSVTDESYPFVALSASEDCGVRLQRMVPRGGGRSGEVELLEELDLLDRAGRERHEELHRVRHLELELRDRVA